MSSFILVYPVKDNKMLVFIINPKKWSLEMNKNLCKCKCSEVSASPTMNLTARHWCIQYNKMEMKKSKWKGDKRKQEGQETRNSMLQN